MAIALACAPVIYPWYLLYLTPFLFGIATLPLTAWSFTVMATYVVWDLKRHGGHWVVPGSVVLVEYAVPLAAVAALLWWRTDLARSAPTNPLEPGRTAQNIAEHGRTS